MTTQSITPGSIVVAVDGSKHAARAVSWAAEQAHLERRPLAVLHAAGEGDVRTAAMAAIDKIRPDALPDLLRHASDVVDDAVDLAHSIWPDLTITAHPLTGDPRQALVEASTHAHLIVMGSRGRGVFASMLLGSVSAAVSKHASCPVVVCRPLPDGTTAQGIVVGADGTPESLPLVEFAFRQASLRQLPVTVLHCFWDVVAAVTGVQETDQPDEATQDLQLLLTESVAGLSEKYPDVQVTLRLAHGLADEGLAHLSERWHLIVVGRHPVNTLGRLLTGSISTTVLERARCTVAVLPEAEAGTADDGH